jgi:hypothetical protein
MYILLYIILPTVRVFIVMLWEHVLCRCCPLPQHNDFSAVSLSLLVFKALYPLLYQVAVNSGGKHCLALSAEGEVYSWGEGDDGKLGHGNRRYILHTRCAM